jgi:uncharacterized membrane protein
MYPDPAEPALFFILRVTNLSADGVELLSLPKAHRLFGVTVILGVLVGVRLIVTVGVIDMLIVGVIDMVLVTVGVIVAEGV